MEEITDVDNDNIDVLVENEDGYKYIIGVGTPQDLLEEMNQEKANYVRPGTPKIIVKKLTKEIVTEAIQAYAEDTGYWLKLHQFANSIDISIFNKLEAEHRKEWEGWFSGQVKNLPTHQTAVNTFESDVTGMTPISPMNENSSPGFTPTSSFESDVMGITPIDKSQFDNPWLLLFINIRS